jgi:hypothetical protein
MNLIELFLPLADNEGSSFAPPEFAKVRNTLIDKFGGLTSFTRAPAEGVEDDGRRERRDKLVVFEVLTDAVDEAWWTNYRQHLETVFKQDRILVRTSKVKLL